MGRFLLLTIVITLATISCSSKHIETENDSNSSSGESVPPGDVVRLVCGSQADCLSVICEDIEKCPLSIALSNKTIFDFVKTYSECEGCITQVFSPDKGVGKCIEYEIADGLQGWTIKFWVSENCNFRHFDPTQANIAVEINSTILAIEHMTPAIEYIKNSSYCQVNSDCKCLSGSGVPFIGCSNYLYAPLNWSGYFSGDDCVCDANLCKQKLGQK
jgi:hypothetical protein